MCLGDWDVSCELGIVDSGFSFLSMEISTYLFGNGNDSVFDGAKARLMDKAEGINRLAKKHSRCMFMKGYVRGKSVLATPAK